MTLRGNGVLHPAILAGGFAIFGGATASPRGMSHLGAWGSHQYFFDYATLGFVRRGFVATLLAPLPDAFVLAAAPWLMLVATFGLFAVFVRWTMRAFHPGPDSLRTAWLWSAVLCPLTFMNLGFDNGRYDVLGLLLTCAALTTANRGKPWLAGSAVALSCLIHEASLVLFAPLVIVTSWSIASRTNPSARTSILVRLCTPIVLVVIALLAWGSYEPGHPALMEHFKKLEALQDVSSDNRFRATRVLTDGPFDHVQIYLRDLISSRRLWQNLLAGIVTSLIVGSVIRDTRSVLRLPLLWVGALAPLLLIPIASDIFRWMSLATLNVYLGFTFICANRPELLDRIPEADDFPSLAPMGLFAVLGPMGVTSFAPVWQEIIQLVTRP
ncbi:DUF2029 domain-containing protein [Myxococcota bacterium]|nr:DUF2029 domain-containing protein [Myxococcota bacterium]